MKVYRSSVSIPQTGMAPSAPTTTPSATVGHPDWLLAVAVAALTLFGLIMIYSTTYPWVDDDPTRFLERQGMYAVAGVVLMLVMMRVRYQFWRRWSVPLMLSTLALLFFVLIVGKAGFGATRWFLNGSIQPSEIAKLTVIIYVADWLASKGQQIRKISLGLLPFSIFIGLVTGLILLQPNFSTACLIAATAFILFFIAGADILQMIIAGLVGSLAAVLLILQAPYRLRRVTIFMDPLADP
ncbi:MAG: FtsW/RodA/SpoVE family cell cycle protein, partial [Anaerolineae bacterium]|nr:FtsW/RodA/SpoVE family cell cycle protein [Anaerolineae bacterium]